MRIVIDRDALKEFWDARFTEENVKEEDKWRGKPEGKTLSGGIVTGWGEYLELPTPLEGIALNIIAQENRIRYGFELLFREPEVLKDSSKSFARQILPSKRIFYPTTDNLTGYVLDPDNNALADISSGQREKISRIVSFGLYGSKIRKYDELSDLVMDLAELSSLAISVVNCTVNKYNSQVTGPKVKLPHLDLHMGIDITGM